MNLRKRGAGQLYGGQWHPRGCACPQCDPGQEKLKAQRARAIAERAAAAAAPPPPAPAAVLAKSAGARPIRFRRPQSDETRRLAELLRAGHTFTSAAEIIEAERQQRKDPP
jgi:hypothetical protein